MTFDSFDSHYILFSNVIETQTKQSTKLSGVDVTIPWTTSQPFTSSPLKDERPAKRHRFELKEAGESVSFEEICDTQRPNILQTKTKNELICHFEQNQAEMKFVLSSSRQFKTVHQSELYGS